MKAKILAGAIAALMYGTGAAAAEKECPPGQAAVHKDKAHKDKDKSAQVAPETVQEEDIILEEVPKDDSLQGTGGSGSASMDGSQSSSTGGSGAIYLNQELRCEPVEQSGTGGSGGIMEPQSSAPVAPPPPAAAPVAPTPPPPPAAAPVAPTPPPPPASNMGTHDSQLSGTSSSADATGGSGIAPAPATDFRPSATSDDIKPLEVEKKSKSKTKGLTLLIGGGVEGYTGALAPQLAPGPSAGVTASIKPTSVLGIEVGYSGALNNIKDAGVFGANDGPDLVRNGGQAALTLAITPTPVQPYLLGGIGISNYHFRGGEALGYSDDTVGNVPAGVGLRGHFGHFTADLRGSYNFLFDKQFAPNIESGGDPSGGGSYNASLNVGGTF
ncbi:hypothetical protein OV208_02995 [Corallococcus sp. bb12-1]|uniref:hypothetical protein n=1 Tax=Corallococcus sp. bb12-1 TaxID=2996784 RepID=UPI00226F038D|nr:hypothetical protein [Corallococcus sp. bb12-1]MCY1040275.1 hypothetical protein [Corallococcus sp. bb12-1]